MTGAFQLPFSRDAFLDVFGVYNDILWPVVAGLWIATLWAFVDRLRGREPGRRVVGLLALQWAWSAGAYHAALFTAINPVAWIFALLFLIEAGLLTWHGVVRRHLNAWSRDSAPSNVLGYGFVGYGLLYPLLAVLGPEAYPRVPTFGVPCPTTLVTIGFLLLLPTVPASVAIVPLLWTVIGGSGAFALGMPIDFGLIAAGSALTTHVWVSRARRIPVVSS